MAGKAEIANLTLGMIKRASAKLDPIRLERGDMIMRMSMEDHLSGSTVSVASLAHRIDRIEGGFERMERRLDPRSDD